MAVTLNETESYQKTQDLRMISSYLICKRIPLGTVLEVAQSEGQKEKGWSGEFSNIPGERKDDLDQVEQSKKGNKIYYEGTVKNLCGGLAGEILIIPKSQSEQLGRMEFSFTQKRKTTGEANIREYQDIQREKS